MHTSTGREKSMIGPLLSGSVVDAQELADAMEAGSAMNSWSVFGERFDLVVRYRVIDYLGAGAYGVVCSAADDETGGEMVAIKKCKHIFQSRTLAKRTLREVRLLRLLQHDNIVKLKSIQAPNCTKFNSLYIVFEIMETDLAAIIKSDQDLSDVHIQFFSLQLFTALEYLHSCKIVHRDLKPRNLLVNSDCHLKIADFGLARFYDTTNDSTCVSMTEYVTTRWYRAPEILVGWKHYGYAVDMWAAGCIVGELLTRQPLFPGQDAMNQIEKICLLLGKPDAEYIAKSRKPSYREILHGLPESSRVSLSNFFIDANPKCSALVEALLCYDPALRSSATSALLHPYLRDVNVLTLSNQHAATNSNSTKSEQRSQQLLQRATAGAGGASFTQKSFTSTGGTDTENTPLAVSSSPAGSKQAGVLLSPSSSSPKSKPVQLPDMKRHFALLETLSSKVTVEFLRGELLYECRYYDPSAGVDVQFQGTEEDVDAAAVLGGPRVLKSIEKEQGSTGDRRGGGGGGGGGGMGGLLGAKGGRGGTGGRGMSAGASGTTGDTGRSWSLGGVGGVGGIPGASGGAGGGGGAGASDGVGGHGGDGGQPGIQGINRGMGYPGKPGTSGTGGAGGGGGGGGGGGAVVPLSKPKTKSVQLAALPKPAPKTISFLPCLTASSDAIAENPDSEGEREAEEGEGEGVGDGEDQGLIEGEDEDDEEEEEEEGKLGNGDADRDKEGSLKDKAKAKAKAKTPAFAPGPGSGKLVRGTIAGHGPAMGGSSADLVDKKNQKPAFCVIV